MHTFLAKARSCPKNTSRQRANRMRELFMDAETWKQQDDLYDSFFNAVGAPSWHGRNFNALRDSIKIGGVNAAQVPYRLVVKNFDKVGDGAKQIAADFVN